MYFNVHWKHNDCIFVASVTDCKFLTKVCNTPYLHVALRWGFDNTPYLHVALRWGSDRHLFMYTMYTSTVVSLLWTSVWCTRLGVLFTRSCQSQPTDYSATAQGVWHGGKEFGFGYHLGTVDTYVFGVSLATALCGRFFQSFLVAGKDHCLYTHWIILDLSGLSVLVSGNLHKITHPVTEQDISALKNTLQFQGQSSRQVQNWPPTQQKLMHLTVQALSVPDVSQTCCCLPH